MEVHPDLARLIGMQQVEIALLKQAIMQLKAEHERITAENAAMAAQIGADHGEPT